MKWILPVVVGCSLASCSAQTTPSKSTSTTMKPLERSAQQPRSKVLETVGTDSIIFIDSAVFDHKLSEKLKAGANPVIIEVVGIDLNNVPERLDKWLSVISENRGEIVMAPSAQYPTGGFGIHTLVMAYDFYGKGKDKLLYSPAKKYNARVEYLQGDGTVQSIILTPKIAVAK